MAEIEGWATGDGAKLTIPGDIYIHLANVLSENDWDITSAWFSVSAAAVRGILSTIRTRIVEFTLNIDEELLELDKGTATSDPVLQAAASHIFNLTIMGTGNVLDLGGSDVVQNIQQQVNVGDLDSLKAFLSEHGLEKQELDELDSAIENSTLADLNDEQSRLRRWVDKAAKAMGKGGSKLLQKAVEDVVLLSLHYYFGDATGGSSPPTASA